MLTDVIFRKYPDGSVVALFPSLAGTMDYHGTCLSYEHVGQHGSASVDHQRYTRPAKPTEYADLFRELTGIGYELLIVKRFTKAHESARQSQCAA